MAGCGAREACGGDPEGHGREQLGGVGGPLYGRVGGRPGFSGSLV